MASNIPKPEGSKKLGDLLQEQQEEPLVLNHERASPRGEMNNSAENSFRCFSGNSSKFLKKSASKGLKGSKKVIPSCSKIVKVVKGVVHKLMSIKVNPRMKNPESSSEGSATKVGTESSQFVGEADSFSSASSTTLFNSCCESEAEDASNSIRNSQGFDAKDGNLQREKEVATDRKLQWRCREDKQQLSPVSVLDDVLSEEGSPSHYKETPSTSTSKDFIVHKKVEDDSNIPIPLKKKPSCNNGKKDQVVLGSNGSSQDLISKRILQGTKQLLLHCVREVLDSHGRRRNSRGFLGPEELGKLLCNNIKSWSKNPGDETNARQILSFDLSASVGEWNDHKEEIRSFGIRIGDSIWEDMINEIVVEMIEDVGLGYMLS